ncbi:MAG TPA: diacylglycerol kinase family protein [Sphingobacteriaceae bacterium]
MKVLFVINPRSGRKEEVTLEQQIAGKAEELAFEYDICPMVDGNIVKKVAKKIYSYKPDIVAAAGGDGTVNLLASILQNSGTPLLIIPSGSANGMAKELDIRSIPAAFELLETGVRRQIDLIRINGRICIHLADVGPNARIVKNFERAGNRGIPGYAKFFLREIFLEKHYRFIIRYGHDQLALKAVSLTFANASKYGTGAVINPHGILDDGYFELVIIRPFPRIKLPGIVWKMFRNKLQTSEYVEVIRCSSATVSSNKRTTLQIDGEVIGKVKNINAEILPLALTVIVPPVA